MAPFILVFILFLCGLLNSYFFPPSKLLPWLLSLVSIPSPPVKREKEKQRKGGGVASAAAASASASAAASTAADLEMVFSTFDTDGDGFITVAELEESLRRLGLSAARAEVVKMVERVDGNGDGLIDLQEFQQLYESIAGGGGGGERAEEEDKEVELRDAFDVFDGNGDGVITVEELGMVLKSLGLKQGCRVEDCRDMIRRVDLDGDGMVNFEEFKKMMMVKGGKFF